MNSITNYFNQIGASIEYTNTYNTNYQLPTLVAEIKFHSPTSADLFIHGINQLMSMDREQAARKSSPAIKNAYETYKLLLKLQGIND